MGIPSGETERVYALYISPAHVRPLGHAQVSLSTASTLQALTPIPSGAQTALLRADGKWYWTDDGQTPSTSLGQYQLADEPFWYDGDLTTLRLVAATGTIDLRIAFYA